MNRCSARTPLGVTFRVTGLVVVMAGLLAACGESKEPEPIPVEDSVFGDQVEAIQRTEEQVKEMEARKQDLDAQLEEAEGQPPNDPAD